MMDDCAYREIASSRTEGEPPFTYHFARSVFDWSHDHDELARRCAWRPLSTLEGGLCAVYVVAADGYGFSKIGISDRPAWRIQGLQTAHWTELRIHACLWVWSNEAKLVEQNSHAVARQRGLEVRREWVKATPDEAMRLVIAVAAKLDALASDADGVETTIRDAEASRLHVMRRQRQTEIQAKAARLGY